jgi:hypothetical protein
MKISAVSVGFALVLTLGCPHAFAQFKGEQLLATAPAGYKISNQQRDKDSLVTELIPEKQNAKSWTERITMQVFYGRKLSPEQFMANTEQATPQSCPDAEVALVRKGEENGYNFILFLRECALDKATRKPEATWFKAIAGNDSFYVVQVTTKFHPSKEKITEWMQYMRKSVVCDSRLPDRPCEPTPGSASKGNF